MKSFIMLVLTGQVYVFTCLNIQFCRCNGGKVQAHQIGTMWSKGIANMFQLNPELLFTSV